MNADSILKDGQTPQHSAGTAECLIPAELRFCCYWITPAISRIRESQSRVTPGNGICHDDELFSCIPIHFKSSSYKIENRMSVPHRCHSVIFLTSCTSVGSVSAYSIVLTISVFTVS